MADLPFIVVRQLVIGGAASLTCGYLAVNALFMVEYADD